MVDGVLARLGSSIDQDTDIWIQNGAKRLEEPSMRVDFFLILLLETEEHLHRSVALLDIHDTFLDVDGHLGGVLVDRVSHRSKHSHIAHVPRKYGRSHPCH